MKKYVLLLIDYHYGQVCQEKNAFLYLIGLRMRSDMIFL